MRTLRIALFMIFVAAGFSVLAQPKDASAPHVDLIVIDGSINPAVDDFIRESIARAKSNGARALIIQLDTPGGLLSSTRTIVKEIFAAPVPVIVYVAPSGAGAGSAGVFITMSAHVAAMAPGTNIGAAHPVAGGGQEVKGVMGEKIENFTRFVQRNHRAAAGPKCRVGHSSRAQERFDYRKRSPQAKRHRYRGQGHR